MSRKEIVMRVLPVIAFAIIVLVAVTKPPQPAWGIPLLVAEIVLMIVSIKAWIPKPHRR